MITKSKALSFIAIFFISTTFATQRYVTLTFDGGTGSLRDVIGNASSGDTIKFIMPSAGQSLMVDLPITIDKDLTILGASAGSVVISPSNAIDRLFEIKNNATVYLKDLYISNYRNGAITIDAGCQVTLERCQIDYCIGFTGQLGGAIYNDGADLTIISSSIHNNDADDGAGLYNANGGRVTVINSSILNNNANNKGAGVYQSGTGSSISIQYSTINGNFSSSIGSGIYIDGGTCEIYNSLVAYNGEGDGDIFGVISSNGYNFVSDNNGIDPASNWPQSTDFENMDPLANNTGGNGGALIVITPDAGSPIIDAGDPNFSGLEFDNRLAYRVMDGDRSGNARIDIGAVEYSSFIVTDNAGSVGTPNSLPNILAQIDTTVAEGPYYVDFDLSFGSISPQQRMTIKRRVLIDGFSLPFTYPPGAWQPGQLSLELRGSSIITDEPMIDFQPGSEGSEIRGAAILLSNMDQLNRAISISADNIHVGGNLIGMTSGGTQSVNRIGVYIDGASNVTIGGSEERDRNVFNSSGQSIYINNNTGNDDIDIKGNWFGINTSGTASNGTVMGTGILIEGGDNITIGGSTYEERNVIGNNQTGITVDVLGQRNIDIIGNYIGTNKDGNGAIGNQTYGIRFNSGEGVNVGGTSDLHRNVISGNSSGGILLDGSNTTKNRIFNNYIGTDANGLTAVANGLYGIQLSNGANGNEIGVAGYKNVLSGNGSSAISMFSCDDNGIIGNYIGLDATGMTALSNNGGAITIFDCNNTRIGATGNGSNFISGNTSGNVIGIYASSGSLNNVIINNYIGVGSDKQTPLSNGNSGIMLDNNVDFTIIGGSGDSSNVIANSTFGSGIFVSEMSGGNPEKNKFHQNSIYNNSNGGITFGGIVQESVIRPEIIELVPDSTVIGTSAPNAYIQFFADSLDQGELFLGDTYADGSGNWSSKLTVPTLPWNVGYLTVLQDSAQNTSEFSYPRELCFAPLHVVTTADDSSCGSLRKALIYASQNPGHHTITFGIENDTIWAFDQYSITGDTNITIDARGKNITIQPAGPLWNAATIAGTILLNVAAPNVEILGLNLYGIVKEQPGLRFESGIWNASGDNLRISNVDVSGFSTYGIVNQGDSALVEKSTILDFGTYGFVSVGSILPRIISSNIGFREGEAPITGNQSIGIATSDDITIGGNLMTEGNTISYCDSAGILILNNKAIIQGNYIGLDISGGSAAGNGSVGIILSGADSTIIGGGSLDKRNVISANNNSGILIDQTAYSDINYNFIGTDEAGEIGIFGQYNGIKIINGSFSNSITRNIIAYNDSVGVVIDAINTDSNIIYKNRFFENYLKGITLSNGANFGILPPTIDTIVGSVISGSATPGAYVEVCADANNQSIYVLDTVSVDTNGKWTYTVIGGQMRTMKLNRLDSITAIQTTVTGSSEFSAPYKIKHVGDPLKVTVHNAMSLDRDNHNEYFIIDYLDQDEYQNNELTIFNKWGIEIYHAVNYQDREPWDGTWNGNIVPDGTYYYILTTDFEFSDENKKYTESGFIEIRSR